MRSSCLSMKLSPLQLESYFATDIRMSAHRDFDSKSEATLDPSIIELTPECWQVKDEERAWGASIKLCYEPPSGTIAPYSFSISLFGRFRIDDSYPVGQIKKLVSTNAPSVLYGIAREMVRHITTQGPFNAVMIPTASFYAPEPRAAADPPSSEKPVKD